MPLRPDERAEVIAIVKEFIDGTAKGPANKEKPIDVAQLVKSEVEKTIAKSAPPIDVVQLVKSEVEKTIAKLMDPNIETAVSETEKNGDGKTLGKKGGSKK